MILLARMASSFFKYLTSYIWVGIILFYQIFCFPVTAGYDEHFSFGLTNLVGINNCSNHKILSIPYVTNINERGDHLSFESVESFLWITHLSIWLLGYFYLLSEIGVIVRIHISWLWDYATHARRVYCLCERSNWSTSDSSES